MTDAAGQFNEKFAVEATPGKTGVAPFRPVAAVWKGAEVDSVAAAGAKTETSAATVKEGGPLAAVASIAGMVPLLARPLLRLVGWAD